MEKYRYFHLLFLTEIFSQYLSIGHTHVNLNLKFLSKLLTNSSKCSKPWRNNEYAERISCPVTIDKKLGSIIGHILGDGSIDKRFHSLFFSNSNKELLYEFRNNMKVIFWIEPRIWIQNRNSYNMKTEWLRRSENLNDVPNGNNAGLFYPKICSDILYAIVGRFAEGKSKQITMEIKNSNLEFKKGLIRAFFDDEGSVRSDNHTVRFHQDNKELSEQIRNLITEFDIIPHGILPYVKRDKERCYFNITGFKEYVKFFQIIGCTSSNKRKEFENLIHKVKNSKRFKKKYAL